MDFSVIFQLRTKKFWWMDVIFYFVISALVATVLCYLIFLIKDKQKTAHDRIGTVFLDSRFRENDEGFQILNLVNSN